MGIIGIARYCHPDQSRRRRGGILNADTLNAGHLRFSVVLNDLLANENWLVQPLAERFCELELFKIPPLRTSTSVGMTIGMTIE